MSVLLICALLGACNENPSSPEELNVDASGEASVAKPSTVTDLKVESTTDRVAVLRFSPANDGLGGTSSYDIRFATDASGGGWGQATSVTKGTCATPFKGTAGATSLSCTVDGLTASTAYNFRLVAFRGTMNKDAVYGGLSNLAKGRTTVPPPAVASVVANPAQLPLYALGDTARIVAVPRDQQGASVAQPLVWTAADTGVVRVDSLGKVTARATGTTTVVVSARCCVAADTVAVTVEQRVASVTVTPASASLDAGASATLSAQAFDARANPVPGKTPVWSSSAAGIASVAADGKVSGVAAGTAVVTALVDGARGDVAVTVKAVGPAVVVRECDQARTAWIWCDDFESDRTGRYFEYAGRTSFTRDARVGIGTSFAMRGHFTAGQVDAGNLKLAFGRTPTTYFRPVDAGTADYREIYWRVWVRNDAGWTGGGGNKMSRATVFAGSNWSQAAIGHVWSGGPGSNALALDPATGTDASGNVRTTKYNDFANLTFIGQAPGAQTLFDPAHVGTWHCVETHMRLNRAGFSDGVFELYVDGRLDASKTGLNWLGAYSAYGINALFLENYWNAGSPQDQSRYFDNLVVSTQPIGCGDGSAPPPPPPPLAPALTSISLSPTAAQLLPSASVRFAVTGRYSDGSSADLTSSTTFGGASGGTVGSGGLYTAGSTPGSYRLDATVSGVSTSGTIVIDAPPPPPAAQGFHEPAGFTPIVNRSFNTKASSDGDRGAGSFPQKTGGSEGWDGIEYRMPNLSVVASDDPLSPGSAMRFTYPAGLASGTEPALAQSQSLGSRRDVYVRTSVRLGPTYFVGAIANKLYFHRQDETTSRGEPFLALLSNSDGTFKLAANFQGTPDNAMGFFLATGPGASISKNRWYVIESLLLMSSGPDQKDGVFRVWVDGTLVIERTDVAYYRAGGAGTFGTLHVAPTFGGGGVASNPSSFYWDLGHAYVSGR